MRCRGILTAFVCAVSITASAVASSSLVEKRCKVEDSCIGLNLNKPGPCGPMGPCGPRGPCGPMGPACGCSYGTAFINQPIVATTNFKVPLVSSGLLSSDMTFDSTTHTFTVGLGGVYKVQFLVKFTSDTVMNGASLVINGTPVLIPSVTIPQAGENTQSLQLSGSDLVEIPAGAVVRLDLSSAVSNTPSVTYSDITLPGSVPAFLSLTRIASPPIIPFP